MIQFLTGAMAGGFVGVAVMCTLQINRIREKREYDKKEGE